MPDEPALFRYIERHNLAPCVTSNATGVSRVEDCEAAERAKMCASLVLVDSAFLSCKQEGSCKQCARVLMLCLSCIL